MSLTDYFEAAFLSVSPKAWAAPPPPLPVPLERMCSAQQEVTPSHFSGMLVGTVLKILPGSPGVMPRLVRGAMLDVFVCFGGVSSALSLV